MQKHLHITKITSLCPKNDIESTSLSKSLTTTIRFGSQRFVEPLSFVYSLWNTSICHTKITSLCLRNDIENTNFFPLHFSRIPQK